MSVNAAIVRHSCNFEVLFITLAPNFIKRAYGDHNINEGDFVCQECSLYLDRDNKLANWANAWPAFYYTLLTDEKFNNKTLSSNFVLMIPETIKASYHSAVLRSGSRYIKEFWHREPKFC